jgi:hypothetical protein
MIQAGIPCLRPRFNILTSLPSLSFPPFRISHPTNSTTSWYLWQRVGLIFWILEMFPGGSGAGKEKKKEKKKKKKRERWTSKYLVFLLLK